MPLTPRHSDLPPVRILSRYPTYTFQLSVSLPLSEVLHRIETTLTTENSTPLRGLLPRPLLRGRINGPIFTLSIAHLLAGSLKPEIEGIAVSQDDRSIVQISLRWLPWWNVAFLLFLTAVAASVFWADDKLLTAGIVLWLLLAMPLLHAGVLMLDADWLIHRFQRLLRSHALATQQPTSPVSQGNRGAV